MDGWLVCRSVIQSKYKFIYKVNGYIISMFFSYNKYLRNRQHTLKKLKLWEAIGRVCSLSIWNRRWLYNYISLWILIYLRVFHQQENVYNFIIFYTLLIFMESPKVVEKMMKNDWSCLIDEKGPLVGGGLLEIGWPSYTGSGSSGFIDGWNEKLTNIWSAF